MNQELFKINFVRQINEADSALRCLLHYNTKTGNYQPSAVWVCTEFGLKVQLEWDIDNQSFNVSFLDIEEVTNPHEISMDLSDVDVVEKRNHYHEQLIVEGHTIKFLIVKKNMDHNDYNFKFSESQEIIELCQLDVHTGILELGPQFQELYQIFDKMEHLRLGFLAGHIEQKYRVLKIDKRHVEAIKNLDWQVSEEIKELIIDAFKRCTRKNSHRWGFMSVIKRLQKFQ